MCISDWKIGRFLRSQSDTYSIAAAGTLTIPAHRERVGIYFATATPILVITQTLVVACNGSPIAKLWGATPIQRLTLQQDGDLCQKEFVLTSTGTTFSVGVHQLFLPEDVLDAMLEDYYRKQYK